MIWTIIVVLMVLWLIGLLAGGRGYAGVPRGGGWVHTLLVIAVILVILSLLGIV